MPNRINITDEEIARLVEDEGKTYTEIAKIAGCHPRTIGRHYRKYKKEQAKKPGEPEGEKKLN